MNKSLNKSIKPLVSAIITSYNADKFLNEAIDSVVGQTIEFDKIQIIIVDDHSADNSWKIIGQYAKKYPNNIIAIRNEKNSGVSFARNEGLKRAIGKYVSFLDGDDTLALDAYEKLIKVCEQNGTQMARGGFQEFDHNGTRPITDYWKKFMVDKPNVSIETFPAILEESSVCNKIYNLSWLKKLDLKFETSMHKSEDVLFIKEFVLRTPHISYIPDIIYNYRRGIVSLTSVTNKKSMLDSIYMRNKLLDLYHKYNNESGIRVMGFQRLIEDVLLPFFQIASLDEICKVLTELQKHLLRVHYSFYDKTTAHITKLKIALIKLGEFRRLLTLLNVGFTGELVNYLEKQYQDDLDISCFLTAHYKHLYTIKS